MSTNFWHTLLHLGIELTPTSPVLISLLFLIVAFLYSSVGHGGASGYLAVLSLFTFAPQQMSTTALLLNVMVASIAFVAYYHAGHFSIRLTYPFLITSIPLALLGGMMHVSFVLYTLLLALALLFAAFRLTIHFKPSQAQEGLGLPPLAIALSIGGAIGLLSGIVGVGGGIFLSPIMLLAHWADPKRTAATSACFIALNSVAGIVGRHLEGTFAVGNLLPFMAAAVIGGYLGSRFGALRFSNVTLRRLLAAVLVVAAAKLLVSAL